MNKKVSFPNYGMKATIDDDRFIDVRSCKRDGLLPPSPSFGWQWSRNGELAASIRVHGYQVG